MSIYDTYPDWQTRAYWLIGVGTAFWVSILILWVRVSIRRARNTEWIKHGRHERGRREE